MENIVIVALVLLIITLAGTYVYKEKKKGKKCIGCPNGGSCSSGDCANCMVQHTTD